jgi:hypothetical protein
MTAKHGPALLSTEANDRCGDPFRTFAGAPFLTVQYHAAGCEDREFEQISKKLPRSRPFLQAPVMLERSIIDISLNNVSGYTTLDTYSGTPLATINLVE